MSARGIPSGMGDSSVLPPAGADPRTESPPLSSAYLSLLDAASMFLGARLLILEGPSGSLEIRDGVVENPVVVVVVDVSGVPRHPVFARTTSRRLGKDG